jgi:hypothetical protein
MVCKGFFMSRLFILKTGCSIDCPLKNCIVKLVYDYEVFVEIRGKITECYGQNRTGSCTVKPSWLEPVDSTIGKELYE